MNNQLIPRRAGSGVELSGTRVTRRVAKGLSEIEGGVLLRAAGVRGEAVVAAEKMDEIDYLAWKAMKGHDDLVKWAAHLAGDDIMLADDLRFFRDMARLGKGEIMADVIDKYRRM
jgi:hypothetical protein